MAGLLLLPVLIGAAALLLLFALIVLTEPNRTSPAELLPNRFGKLGLFIVLLAPVLWRHEPGSRGYLVAMPLDRVRHLLLLPVLIGAAALLLLFALIVLTEPNRTSPAELLPNRFGKLGLFIVLLAPVLWRHEPGSRGYLVAMPLDRVRHLLLRTGAGWLWTMALVGATVCTFLALTALTGGSVVVWQPGISLQAGGGWAGYQEAMAALRELDLQRRQPLPTWQWAVPFVAATVLFFLGNAVSIARKAAMLWIVGAYFVFSVLVSATETSAPAMHRGLSTVIGGRFGLETLLSGNVGRLVHTLQLSGGPAPVHALQPDLAAWLGSVALWLLIALIANVFALRSVYRFRGSAARA